MSFNIEQAYQDLDQNYKEKRFGSLQNFTQYVSKNKELYLSYNNKNAKQYGDFDSMEEYMINIILYF